MTFNFKEWLQKEMTACGSVGGGAIGMGGSFTNNIAGLARPILATVVRRGSLGDDKPKKKRKKKKHKKKD